MSGPAYLEFGVERPLGASFITVPIVLVHLSQGGICVTDKIGNIRHDFFFSDSATECNLRSRLALTRSLEGEGEEEEEAEISDGKSDKGTPRVLVRSDKGFELRKEERID